MDFPSWKSPSSKISPFFSHVPGQTGTADQRDPRAGGC